jgi:acetyltransferase-like isoleucine patch superfamily enzyme
MMGHLETLKRKLDRDQQAGLSARRIANKSVRYAKELLLAPLYLRDVDDIGPGVRTLGRPRIENLGYMRLGAGTLLRSVNVPVELATAEGAELCIGALARLNYGVSIGVMGSVTLGDRVRLGPYVMIIDSEFHDVYERDKRAPPRPVVLEDDVWVGAKASVLPGVRIGRGSVVGTGAVVTCDVPPFTIVAGVPAREVKRLDPSRFIAASP